MVLQADCLVKLKELMEDIQDTHNVILARTILVGLNNGYPEQVPFKALA